MWWWKGHIIFDSHTIIDYADKTIRDHPGIVSCKKIIKTYLK